MTTKICHLCGTNYNDDPFFKEQPAHPPDKCLDILKYRLHQAGTNLSEIERQIKRAEKEYGG